jgi:hypothetical protein
VQDWRNSQCRAAVRWEYDGIIKPLSGFQVRVREFSETYRGTHPYFFGTIGLGNRKGTDAMIRAERFIAGIAIVSIIASLGYIALTLIG